MLTTLFRGASLALFSVILFAGGAGNEFPLLTAVVQTAAIFLLAICLFLQSGGQGGLVRWPVAFLMIVPMALTMLYNIPLPPVIWTNLPGRQIDLSLINAAGLKPGWHSLSLDSQRTITAALELLPGMAMFYLVRSASPLFRRRILTVFSFVALGSAILGTLQRLDRDAAILTLFDTIDRLHAPGLFINRNHQATMLLAAIPIVTYLLASSTRFVQQALALRIVLIGIVLAILTSGIVATTSRAGFLMLPLAFAGAYLAAVKRRWRLQTIGMVLAPLSLAVAIGSQLPTTWAVLDRIATQSEEGRAAYLANTRPAIARYWPIGSGIGTFRLVYPTVESFNQLQESYVNNAHNDYVETLLEGGLSTLLVLGLLVSTISLGFVERSRNAVAEGGGRQPIAVLTAILIFALHSFVDYPLRMMSLMAVAGMLVGLLVHPGVRPEEPLLSNASERGGHLSWLAPGKLAGIMALLLMAPVIWISALSYDRLKAKSPQAALAINPWDQDAQIMLAGQALDLKDLKEARRLIEPAVLAVPMNAGAQAIMVRLLQAEGNARAADDLLQRAGQLGWREPTLQYLLIARALAQEDYPTTVRRGDALLRQRAFYPQMITLLRETAAIPVGNAAIANALSVNPNWRRDFLEGLSDFGEADFADHQRLLDRLSRTQAPPTIAEINAFLSRLLAARRIDEVTKLATVSGQIAGKGDLLTAQSLGVLAGQSGIMSPLAWQNAEALGVKIDASIGNTPTIHIRSDSATLGTVMSKVLLLPGGPANLTIVMQEEAPNSVSSLRWSMSCADSGQFSVVVNEISNVRRLKTVQLTLRFVIPSNCRAQQLTLYVDASTQGPIDLTFEKMGIQ